MPRSHLYNHTWILGYCTLCSFRGALDLLTASSPQVQKNQVERPLICQCLWHWPNLIWNLRLRAPMQPWNLRTCFFFIFGGPPFETGIFIPIRKKCKIFWGMPFTKCQNGACLVSDLSQRHQTCKDQPRSKYLQVDMIILHSRPPAWLIYFLL